MKVVIVGSGVAGLALAVALRRAGIDYVIVERAAELSFVGAGIQLSPNATRILARMQVLEHLQERLVRPGQHRFVDWRDASALLTTPLGQNVEKNIWRNLCTRPPSRSAQWSARSARRS